MLKATGAILRSDLKQDFDWELDCEVDVHISKIVER